MESMDELVCVHGRPRPFVNTGHGIYPLILAFMDFQPKFYVQAQVSFLIAKRAAVWARSSTPNTKLRGLPRGVRVVGGLGSSFLGPSGR
jgi:hypothetical protein